MWRQCIVNASRGPCPGNKQCAFTTPGCIFSRCCKRRVHNLGFWGMAPVVFRPSKRIRMESEFEWRVCITSSATFRTFINVLKEILINCNFYLKKTSTFTGIFVDSVDPSLVCMVKSCFECKIQTCQADSGDAPFSSYDAETLCRINEESFCVPMESLKTLLKDAGDMLEITRYRDTAPDVIIHSYDRADKLNSTTSRLGNIDDSGAPIPMDSIGSSQMVEIELQDLKSLVKMARELKATHMRFLIEHPAVVERDDGEVPDPNAVMHNLFTISIETENATLERSFHSMTQRETSVLPVGGLESIRALSTTTQVVNADRLPLFRDATIKFDEVFSTTYLDLILKSMVDRGVKLFMAPDMPLIVEYSLGSDMSYLKVILAPKVSSDDES